MPSGSAKLHAVKAAGSEALQRLQRGDISLDEYLDIKADEAADKLAHLSPERRAEVRDFAREQLRTDPLLAHYIQRATGQTPSDHPPDAS